MYSVNLLKSLENGFSMSPPTVPITLSTLYGSIVQFNLKLNLALLCKRTKILFKDI